jgi:hypothetical protein
MPGSATSAGPVHVQTPWHSGDAVHCASHHRRLDLGITSRGCRAVVRKANLHSITAFHKWEEGIESRVLDTRCETCDTSTPRK